MRACICRNTLATSALEERIAGKIQMPTAGAIEPFASALFGHGFEMVIFDAVRTSGDFVWT